MNLQLHLLIRISLTAWLCLLISAAFLLHQNHSQTVQNYRQTAEGVARHLQSLLLLKQAGIGLGNPFPDFEFWKQSSLHSGLCLSYQASNASTSRSLCSGLKPAEPAWPKMFERIYRQIFNPAAEIQLPIGIAGKTDGLLSLIPSAELEITAAWQNSLNLMVLSGVTVVSVCLLVYLSISRALQPAQTIVAHLKQLESGALNGRLPGFALNEWHWIAQAINQLTATQQQLLAERQQLLTKLMALQEQERRDLARELHDEYGQCLAAINATACSIRHSAGLRCPDIIEETHRINRVTDHLLKNLHGLLKRLRPAEFDELGLVASLNSLVMDWNRLRRDKVVYSLQIVGDCDLLSEHQAFSLLRITQEALTNIAKHATASQVDIQLKITPETAKLTIKDNGKATQLPFAKNEGIGLLGIRERLAALDGQLQLSLAESHGLTLEADFPINTL
jgi:signal transduction histidine kinase